MIVRVYTIGHSNHGIDRFIELLRLHAITAVADIRSTPYSRYNPQFDCEALRTTLRSNGIQYVQLGKELGARSDDPACYKDGIVQYNRLQRTDTFLDGIRRVHDGAAKYRLTLMCSEKDPLECHRSILISRHLVEIDVEVLHILSDGKLESQQDVLKHLAKRHRVDFDANIAYQSEDEKLNYLYLLQEKRIAYSIPTRYLQTEYVSPVGRSMAHLPPFQTWRRHRKTSE